MGQFPNKSNMTASNLFNQNTSTANQQPQQTMQAMFNQTQTSAIPTQNQGNSGGFFQRNAPNIFSRNQPSNQSNFNNNNQIFSLFNSDNPLFNSNQPSNISSNPSFSNNSNQFFTNPPQSLPINNTQSLKQSSIFDPQPAFPNNQLPLFNANNSQNNLTSTFQPKFFTQTYNPTHYFRHPNQAISTNQFYN
jgi:hypothetical protein